MVPKGKAKKGCQYTKIKRSNFIEIIYFAVTPQLKGLIESSSNLPNIVFLYSGRY